MFCSLQAAGIAAAFNAPVGGVLFTYEETASFWSKALTWRAFFCAVVSAYVIAILLSGIDDPSKWGSLSSAGMMSFGDFTTSSKSWSIWEIPIFALIGLLGGEAARWR